MTRLPATILASAGLWALTANGPRPALGAFCAVLILIAPVAFWTLKLAIEGALLGWSAAIGVRAAGLFRQPRRRRVRRIVSARAGLSDTSTIPPRPRYRSGDRYQPFDIENGDDWPSNLPANRRLPPR
jgi:hypothetical protein